MSNNIIDNYEASKTILLTNNVAYITFLLLLHSSNKMICYM